jgi:deoxyribose-phosphate aldolase
MSLKSILDQAKAYQQDLPTPAALEIPGPESIALWIDHTLLKPQATAEQVRTLCDEAREYRFASVCLNPVYIPLAVAELEGTGIPVCTVIGFPLGANQTTVKAFEAQAACDAGAVELDMVLSIGQLKSGDFQAVLDDIRAVAETCHKNDALLKVILEMCYLDSFEKIMACLLCKKAEADFVKTSTGFGSGGATLEDVTLMRALVGPPDKMGVKAAGGIRTWEDAQNMIAAGANRIGASSGVKIVAEAKAGAGS